MQDNLQTKYRSARFLYMYILFYKWTHTLEKNLPYLPNLNSSWKLSWLSQTLIRLLQRHLSEISSTSVQTFYSKNRYIKLNSRTSQARTCILEISCVDEKYRWPLRDTPQCTLFFPFLSSFLALWWSLVVRSVLWNNPSISRASFYSVRIYCTILMFR